MQKDDGRDINTTINHKTIKRATCVGKRDASNANKAYECFVLL
jgi:hypothetical protein